jgi:uncharacterized protein DUF4147
VSGGARADSSAPDPVPTDLPPLVKGLCRAALEGADVYRAVRRAVQFSDGTLRVGNRFVRAERYREIAFVSLGNASVSAALGITRALGQRLTQGFLAGPLPAPAEIPFRDQVVADLRPGSVDGIEAAHAVLEMAEGLSARDLLILAISPGALGCLATPPEGLDRFAYRELLHRITSAGVNAEGLVRAVRVLSDGAVGGRLVLRADGPEVVPLVVERGESDPLAGGGPTIPITPGERGAVRHFLETAGLLGSLPPGTAKRLDPGRTPLTGGRGSERPVAIVGPADALEAAGNFTASRKWISRLGALTVPGRPEEAAQHFLEAVDRTVEGLGGPPLGRGDVGLAVFSSATFDVLEGGEDAAEVQRFLEVAGSRLNRRRTTLLAFSTSGVSAAAKRAAGGMVEATGLEPVGRGELMGIFPSAPGVTDVGVLIAALVRRGPR